MSANSKPVFRAEIIVREPSEESMVVTAFCRGISPLIILYLLIWLLSTDSLVCQSVRLGIDVLEDMNFEALRGQRVALLTNSSGRTSDLRSSVDVFRSTQHCSLVSLLAPEHGYFSTVPAGLHVENDSLDGIPVISLYGKYRKPVPEMLANCDVVVADIQDIGVRSYTFISSLFNVMQACAELDKPVLVLDRPNPLGGLLVDGPVADSTILSFVAIAPIPYLHGMTIGELAMMFNEEGWLGRHADGTTKRVDLQVVKMEGWSRAMTWESTGLSWLPTSPNMPSVESIRGAAAIGLLGELGIVSIGIGTTSPFRYLGAPKFEWRALLDQWNRRDQFGLTLVRTKFRPSTGKHTGTDCDGFFLTFSSDSLCRPFSAGISLMLALRAQNPAWFDQAKVSEGAKAMFRKVSANNELVDALFRYEQDAVVHNLATRGTKDFEQRRSPYLLYR